MYNRIFKLWYYTVSHKQMLLRSLGNDKECNLDIYFGDVIYIEMPTELRDIHLISPTDEDVEYIENKLGKTDKIITVMISKGHKYYVVSSIMKQIENNLSMFELPFDIPNYMCGIYIN